MAKDVIGKRDRLFIKFFRNNPINSTFYLKILLKDPIKKKPGKKFWEHQSSLERKCHLRLGAPLVLESMKIEKIFRGINRKHHCRRIK
jgi:hypothetical protein